MNKEEILEEFAKQLDYWVRESVDAATSDKADLAWSEHANLFEKLQELTAQGALSKDLLTKVFEEVLRGYTVSLFTVLDGGTALAERVKLDLQTGDGESVGELHDEFVMHLINTDRLE